jgi:hypothetical protein
MTEYIYQEGLKRLEEYKLQDKRLFFNLQTEDVNLIIKHIINNYNIDLSCYNTSIIYKENKENYSMKWHCDDCFIQKNKKDYIYENNNYCKISDKYYLVHAKPLPVYTLLIYLSDYNIDYTGGELCFTDIIVTPNKYDVIFFDSREIHKVNLQKSGTRKNYLIKFYEKLE